jgi:hypothetical protein
MEEGPVNQKTLTNGLLRDWHACPSVHAGRCTPNAAGAAIGRSGYSWQVVLPHRRGIDPTAHPLSAKSGTNEDSFTSRFLCCGANPSRRAKHARSRARSEMDISGEPCPDLPSFPGCLFGPSNWEAAGYSRTGRAQLKTRAAMPRHTSLLLALALGLAVVQTSTGVLGLPLGLCRTWLLGCCWAAC